MLLIKKRKERGKKHFDTLASFLSVFCVFVVLKGFP